MSIALFIAQFVLFAVFLLAGLAKLADRVGSRQAIVDFGVPAQYAAPLATILPVVELVVALALIPTEIGRAHV